MIIVNKRAYMDDLVREAGKVAPRGELGNYRGSTDSLIADKHGRLLTAEAEQETCWTEHFNEVLSTPPPITEADIQDPDVDITPTERGDLGRHHHSSIMEKLLDKTA